jgi:hypothetical protein
MGFAICRVGRPVTGKIDRLGEIEDGSWGVIDYMSEPVSSFSEYALMGKEYAVSTGVHMNAAEQLLNGKPVEMWQYLTDTRECICTRLE